MLADDWRNVFGEMTILSLENAVALPYLTYRLAQDGARVLRLEDPVAPDPNRRVGDPIGEGESAVGAYFAMVNCGKEGITLPVGLRSYIQQ